MQRVRKRIHAWLLTRGNDRYEPAYANRKRGFISSLTGTVVEIGPGGGNNLPYYRGGITWIGVEPNPFLHQHLLARGRQLGLSIQLREESVENLGLEDASVDNVVGTLVLCSVNDPSRALAEIRRILKPGGRYIFIEHVTGSADTLLRVAQHLVRPAWQILADGCRPDQETLQLIEQAGFRAIQSERFRLPVPIVAPHIVGAATK